MLQSLAVSFALAFLTESLVEYIFGTPMDKIPKLAPYKWWLMYISIGVGIGLALFYQLDLIAIIAQAAGITPDLTAPTIVGMVLTGMGIGRGANYLSQFVSTYLKPKA